MTHEVEMKLALLPEKPGCYLMKSQGNIIYVGKAKNLKNRVRQYFHTPERHTPKVRAMVEKVDDFDIVIVDTDLEAFTLECNLIKLHMPRYNIVLKDDKHYPYIRLDLHEEYPACRLVRTQKKDGARYFGPYHGAVAVRDVLDTVRMLFPIRSCTGPIVPGRAKRACVYHQMGRCPAPCMGMVSRTEYMEQAKRVAEFLGGKYDSVLDELRQKMNECAASFNYERAAVYRDRIRTVEQVMQKQQAISTDEGDYDVIAAASTGVDKEIQVLIARGGRMIDSRHFVLEGELDNETPECLTRFLTQYYSPDNIPPREILLDRTPENAEETLEYLEKLAQRRVMMHVPQRGDKVKLMNMAVKNLRDAAEKQRKKLANAEERTLNATRELGEILGLANIPHRVEGYDISNTLGEESVASMVVSIDGVAATKEYRHFRIRTVEGANDFASIHEVILRRLTRALREKSEIEAGTLQPERAAFAELPDLILVDGGRGQLNEGLRAMRESGLNIPMFGLAKRIDEIIVPDSDESIYLDRHSPALHLIERLRDESHRFAITHHRARRANRSMASVLEGTGGVGPARRRQILAWFGTVEKLSNASFDEIRQVPRLPQDVARRVYEKLHGPGSTGEDNSMNIFSVAIDGPAGAGKSTIAKEVARLKGAMYMDTGAMYRTVGLGVLRMGKDPMDEQDVIACLNEMTVSLNYDGGQRVLLNGEDVTDYIRTPECSAAASAVSKVPEVREKMVALQRETALGRPVVMDGRDIGTRVLPDATLKVYLTASAEERARRRLLDLSKSGVETDFAQVLADIEARDLQDMTRAVDPLRKADDAVEVDSTDMTPEDVVRRVLTLLEKKIAAKQ